MPSVNKMLKVPMTLAIAAAWRCRQCRKSRRKGRR